jgi:hypothetical protein
MDSASFHKTDDVKQLLKENQVTLAVIPPGCTGLLQPLDVAINKAFKALLRVHLERILEMEADGEVSGRAAVSARRIAVTKAVGDAWDELCDQKPQLVVQSFVHTGIAVNPTGSEDSMISIKDLPAPDFSGWERAEVDEAAAALKIELTDDGFSWAHDEDEGEYLGRQKRVYTLVKVLDLKLLARQRGLQGYSRLPKEQLIELLLQGDAAGIAAGHPILLEESMNELPPPQVAEQRSWEIEYHREAAAEEVERRAISGLYEGLLGR